MYRYSVDNAITYTSEDLVLFKESPFACWMERLTLENPDHGIPPNVDSTAPQNSMEPQDDLADTLRAEGKDVILVDWDMGEPLRRTATLEAMRHGADFIVNGQLALGSLSGSANLLMRTSGYSDLGNFLYVPCNTQRKTNLHAALRLCFLADLLHSLQGQLPPQMLIIRGGSDVVPLQTEDHIYHYRAVKQRFMSIQHSFRKHKMPDPAESSHFGRWSDCANEVLKQRALRKEQTGEVEEVEAPGMFEQLQSAVGSAAYDLDEVNNTQSDPKQAGGLPGTGATLAEQARTMSPTNYAPSPSGTSGADTLQNLAFIGSSTVAPTIGQGARAHRTAEAETRYLASPRPPAEASRAAPSPSLRNPEYAESRPPAADRRASADLPTPAQGEQRPITPPPVDVYQAMEKAHPLDSTVIEGANPSMVDLDAGAVVTDKPAVRPPMGMFNSSLITGEESDEEEPGA